MNSGAVLSLWLCRQMSERAVMKYRVSTDPVGKMVLSSCTSISSNHEKMLDSPDTPIPELIWLAGEL